MGLKKKLNLLNKKEAKELEERKKKFIARMKEVQEEFGIMVKGKLNINSDSILPGFSLVDMPKKEVIEEVKKEDEK